MDETVEGVATQPDDNSDVRMQRLRVEHLHKSYLDGTLGLRAYIEELDKLPSGDDTRLKMEEEQKDRLRKQLEQM